MGQPAIQMKYAESITVDDARQHLQILASDEYEGRETGTKGAQKAALYIANIFQEQGLGAPVENTYFQEMKLKGNSLDETTFMVKNSKKEFLKDFYITPNSIKNIDLNTEEILFIGYGIHDSLYNDYQNIHANGKVLFYIGEGEPTKDSLSILTHSKKFSPWAKQSNKKLQFATAQNPTLILVYNPKVDLLNDAYRDYLKASTLELDSGQQEQNNKPIVINIGKNVADELLAATGKNVVQIQQSINESGTPMSMALPIHLSIKIQKTATSLRAHNVLGYLEGSDPVLKNELLIITAHYDHIGMQTTGSDTINNGADDDGSGTTAVLALAKAFSKAKKEGYAPKRSILFMTVVGEEKGLLGSAWYVQHPVFPLSNTITNLNIDMVGRVDKAHENNPNYIYVIGSNKLSSTLGKINRKANDRYTKMTLDFTYDSPKDPNRFYYRSDHYNFAKNHIPIIFYFNGVHEDYHKPSDEVSKINFDLLVKRTRLVFHTAWEIANRTKRPALDNPHAVEEE